MPKIETIRTEYEGQLIEEEALVEEDLVAAWAKDAALSIAGQPTPRVDGFERVTGWATYTSDVRLPGMLYGRILRSPYAHARIVNIDVSEAEALPGVLGVMSARDAPEVRLPGREPLFREVSLHEGDEVAAVVALDDQIAEDALGLINVEYEELPFVTSVEEALQEGASSALGGSNLVFVPERDVYERGSVEEGLKQADVVVEATYHTPAAIHNPLEPHGSVAHWVDGKLTVWDSTQGIFMARQSLAQALDIPLHRVRVITHYMGGGFGNKLTLGKQALVAALFSRMTGRPVQIMLDRKGENLVGGNRAPSRIECKAGARKDGTLTALYAKGISGLGTADREGFPTGGPFRTMYRCPNVRTEEQSARMNTGSACAFRAPGYVEGAFALECLMDELAERLTIDPLELRMINYAHKHQVQNLPYTSKKLNEAYEAGAIEIGWHERRNKTPHTTGRFRRGVGMASHIWGGSGHPPSYAIVKMNADGTAHVITGSQDIGSGTKSGLAQIAAEELGIRLEDVQMLIGDTDAAPYSVTSGGSMTLASAGPAVRNAAYQAKAQLLDLAAYLMDAPAEGLAIRDRMILSTSDPSKRMPLTDVTAKMGDYTIIGKGGRAPNPQDATVHSFGAQFVEVEVDMETGQVRVLRVAGQHDIGRAINPLLVTSQFEGGVIQGVGLALMEQRILDAPTGRVVNPNLEEYKMPTSLDVPDIDVTPVNEPDPSGNILGIKGVGEPPIIPTAPAVANAVYNATGLRIRSLPITPKAILDASAEAGRAKDRRKEKGTG